MARKMHLTPLRPQQQYLGAALLRGDGGGDGGGNGGGGVTRGPVLGSGSQSMHGGSKIIPSGGVGEAWGREDTAATTLAGAMATSAVVRTESVL